MEENELDIDLSRYSSIQTKDRKLEAGGKYQYKEGMVIADITVLSFCCENEDSLKVSLKVDKSNFFKELDFEFEAREKIGDPVNWMLLDISTYPHNLERV